MTRSLVLAASFLLVGAVGVSAQHPQSHPQGRPHGTAGHEPMDPALHAALHALMHGSWHGTATTPSGTSSKVDLKVGADKTGAFTFAMTGDKSIKLGPSTDFAVDGSVVTWTQDVSGKPCQVAAKVTPATGKDPDALTGKVSCTDGERTLNLRKTAQ